MSFVDLQFLGANLYQIVGVESLSEHLRCLVWIRLCRVVVKVECLVTNNVLVRYLAIFTIGFSFREGTFWSGNLLGSNLN